MTKNKKVGKTSVISFFVLGAIQIFIVIGMPLLLYFNVPFFLGKVAVVITLNWKLYLLICAVYWSVGSCIICKKALKTRISFVLASILSCMLLLFYYPEVHEYIVVRRMHKLIYEVELVLENSYIPSQKQEKVTNLLCSYFPVNFVETNYDNSGNSIISVIYNDSIFKPNDNIILYSPASVYCPKFNIWTVPIIINEKWRFNYLSP